MLGIDFGYNDETAFVVAAWSDTNHYFWYVHAEKHAHMTIKPTVDKITELERAFGGFLKIIVDTGGGGKTLQETLARDFGVFTTTAKKTEKLEHIRLLNSDFRLGKVKILEDECRDLVEELLMHQWRPPLPGKPRQEDPRSANHACDAALYLHKESLHHLARDPFVAPEKGTLEWERWQEDLREQKAVEHFADSSQDTFWKDIKETAWDWKSYNN